VSINGEEYSQVQKLEIPDDGLVIQLKSSGGSKYFENIQKQLRDTTLFTYLTRMLLNRLADRNLSNSTQFIGELKAITELLNKYVVLNDLW